MALNFVQKLLAPSVHFLAKRTLPTPMNAADIWPKGTPIVIPNTRLLVNTFYLVAYDQDMNATPLSLSVTQPPHGAVERLNDFASDPRLIAGPSPSDYVGDEFDKGHLTPAKDAGNEVQMIDTFLMSNMTPQAPKLNRNAWKELEEHVRTLDTTHVATGAIYSKTPKLLGKHNIAIPDSYWKAVWLKDGSVQCFKADNLATALVTPLTVGESESLAGFKIFY